MKQQSDRPKKATYKVLAFMLTIGVVLAAPPATAQAQEEHAPAPGLVEPDGVSVTQHSIMVNGQELAYTARAGYMPMKDDAGELRAKIFYTAYTLDEDGGGDRPLTFAYNGGPGSASLWVHLGAMGPKRVLMDDEGMPLPPPYELVVNEATWLRFTDLVFIDPVGTGFSRPAEGVEGSEFWGVEEDVASVGDFIKNWVTAYGRFSSPTFLAGESYGTTRSAGLAGYLQQRHGMHLNGIVLISSVLDFRTLRSAVGNDLPFIGFFPTFTATAWYHNQLSPELQADFEETVQAARDFAIGPYASALLRGASLDPAERERVAARMAELSGLSAEYIDRANLRVTPSRFRKELLRDQGVTVARLDSRHTGLDRDSAGEGSEYDASSTAIRGPYTAMINGYLRDELGFDSERVYETSGRVRPWNWGSGAQGFTYVTETLRRAMSENRFLRVLVVNGYYDLATPFFATELTFDHLGGDPELLERVSMAYYPAGHMMYTKKSSLERLAMDVERFIDESLAR